jgi:tetratricopeptide (TPR) repeat protein
MPEKEATEGPRKTSRSLSGLRALAFNLGKKALPLIAGAPFIAMVVVLLVYFFQRQALDIDAIGVPESLGKAGLTSVAATERLRAGIIGVEDIAQTTMKKVTVETEQELSAIIVPVSGFTLEGIAATLRGLLPGWQKKITGEFTESGNQLTLQVRLNGRKIFEETAATTDPAAASALIGRGLDGAAFSIVREVQPYFAASALYGEDGGADLAGAEAVADDIIDRNQSSDDNVVRALNLKAIIAKDRGDFQLAEIYCKKAVEVAPKEAATHNNLGSIYIGQNKMNAAISEYNEAIHLDPKFAQPHGGLANLHYRLGNPNLAIKEYRIAVDLDRRDPWLHLGLADVYREQKKFDEALAEYRAAVRLDPKSPMLHSRLGNILRDQDKLEAARDEYLAADRLDPNASDTHNNLGIVYHKQGKLDDAIAEFVWAARLDSKNAEFPLNLGNVYFDRQDAEAARVEYQRSIDLNSEFAPAHAALGRVYSDQGKLDMAVVEFEKAIRLDPNNALAHSNLGWVYGNLGRSDAAIEEYQAAIRLSPTPEAYYDLGVELLEGSKLIDACSAFTAGSALNPNASDYLAQIKMVDKMMAGRGRCTR